MNKILVSTSSNWY